MDSAKEAKPLRAFAVTEDSEGFGGIVFARHAIVARREGAGEFGDGDFDSVRCVRAPWADRFAQEGIVPVSAMVEAGWHFECSGCGVRIDSDLLWERDILPEDLIGTQHSAAYCGVVCEARHALEQAEREHRSRRWIRRFRKFVRARFPDAVLVDGIGLSGGGHAYAEQRDGKWLISQVSVQFTFPGMTIAPAVLRYDRIDRSYRIARSGPVRPSKPYFEVCNGDREAFESWATSQPHCQLNRKVEA